MRFAHIAGWGKYTPRRVLTNQDLEKMLDTSDEWIRERTGVRERRLVEAGETVSTMSVAAAKEALARAQMTPEELDLIIVATSSPDYHLPAAASLVQHQLGASHAAAFDLRAGCTGFVYALAVAHQFIATGAYDNVLVVGAEIISRFLDWEDRSTCVLFGDGAGAVALRASHVPTGPLDFVLGSDGSQAEALIVPGGGSRYPFSQEVLDKKLHHLRMNGRRVFRFATRILVQAVREVISRGGLTLEDVSLIIPHQANLRIIEVAARNLGLPLEKFYINLDRYGNTSAASVPLALCEAAEEGCLQDGDNVILVGFGAGLTWAAMLVKWGLTPAMPLFLWRPEWLGDKLTRLRASLPLPDLAPLPALLSLPFLARKRRRK